MKRLGAEDSDLSSGAPDPRLYAVGGFLALAITALATLGLANRASPEWGLSAFDLDRELRVAAAFSGAVLVSGAAVFAVLAGRAVGGLRRASGAMAALLAVMAGDEVVELHERLEAATGVDWQLLYLPVAMVGALAWLRLLRAWRGRTLPGVLLIAGAACWGVSQVLEAVQWNGDVQVEGYVGLMLAEEMLEITGSAFLLLAGLAVLVAEAVRHDEAAPLRSGGSSSAAATPDRSSARPKV